MADRLEWLNQHLVLLNYETVGDTVEKERFKIRADLEGLVSSRDTSEECLKKLASAEKWKDACEYLAYSMHRRAAVWWGYICVLSLHEELDNAPESERDIADIGKPAPHAVPEWAKNPPPDEAVGPDRVKESLAPVYEALDNLKKQVTPSVQERFDAVLNEMYSQFKDKYGFTPMELLEKAIEAYDPGASLIDTENSPIVKAERELKEQIEKVRTETVDLIKSVLPPKVPAHVKKMRASAMDAVYGWIAVPDEINSQRALDTGNECPDTPAGLLALTAFWSFGNLTPTGGQFIAAPAGLAANGLCQVLLNAALHQGGTRKPAERFRHYFDLGLEVAYGRNNWGESLERPSAPHRDAAFGMKGAGRDKENTDASGHVRFRERPTEL